MSRNDTGLLVIDVQEKLIPAVGSHGRIVWNVRRLIDAARLLGLPAVASEQYPKGTRRHGGGVGLPATQPTRQARVQLPRTRDGHRRSCDRHVEKLLLCGIETHVCVQQTALDLMADGWRIFIAADAVGGRFEIDHQIGLRRMEASGAVLTTTEAALFEWCETAAARSSSKLASWSANRRRVRDEWPSRRKQRLALPT